MIWRCGESVRQTSASRSIADKDRYPAEQGHFSTPSIPEVRRVVRYFRCDSGSIAIIACSSSPPFPALLRFRFDGRASYLQRWRIFGALVAMTAERLRSGACVKNHRF